jgi:hypothetical protein
MRREIDECLVHPERAHLRELYDLLQVSDGTAASNAMGTMAGTHFGDLMVTRAAVAPAVELMRQEAPWRHQEALARFAAGDTSTLETYLLNELQSQFDRDWALGILLFLPRL